MRKPKTLGHAAPLSGCADADAVLPVAVSRDKESNASVLGASATRSENLHPSCGQRLVEVSIPLLRSTLTPKSAVIRHSRRSAKGPPLGAFCLAPHQRENQGYSERNHDYGESQQIEHEHLPSLARDFQHR
jgi:hypothetical protein